MSIYENHERLADLVRYARVHLLEKGLITDDEYAELALDGDAKERVKRLESYDVLRDRLEYEQARTEELRVSLERCGTLARENPDEPSAVSELVARVLDGTDEEVGR